MHDTNVCRSPVNIRRDAAAGKPRLRSSSVGERHLNFRTSESATGKVPELKEAGRESRTSRRNAAIECARA